MGLFQQGDALERGRWLTGRAALEGNRDLAGPGATSSFIHSQQECMCPKGKITVQSRPPTGKLIVEIPPFMVQNPSKQSHPVGWDFSYSFSAYITNLTRKSDPTAAGAKKGNHPHRRGDTAWTANSSP